LLKALYFMLDGFAGVSAARELRPQRGRGWLLFKGIVSPGLAAASNAGWPFTSVWLVGLLIGINLFFDGLSLLMPGLTAGTSCTMNQARSFRDIHIPVLAPRLQAAVIHS
jgi:uncharacterized membrane protein HdeD (DUF308 family)